jgi:hypothetical protein
LILFAERFEIAKEECNWICGSGVVIVLGRLRGFRGMRAQLSSNRWDRKKNLSPTSSTFSSDLSGVLVKLTLRRRVGFSRILDVADGCRKFAGRSANLGERIVKPALAALTLLDGLGESLMVDLDLFLLA